MTDQERILNAIEDPGAAKVLNQIWEQINGEPLQAARMMRAFQSAGSIITDTLKALPAQWEALEQELSRADLHRARFVQDLRDFRVLTSGELAAAVNDLKGLQEFFEKLDHDDFLNRANRILDLCERLSKAKRDGTFDLVKKLL